MNTAHDCNREQYKTRKMQDNKTVTKLKKKKKKKISH